MTESKLEDPDPIASGVAAAMPMHRLVGSNLHDPFRASPAAAQLRRRRPAGTDAQHRLRLFLGLTAAAGLALVAIFAQLSFPLLSPVPLPSGPSEGGGVAKAVALDRDGALGTRAWPAELDAAASGATAPPAAAAGPSERGGETGRCRSARRSRSLRRAESGGGADAGPTGAPPANADSDSASGADAEWSSRSCRPRSQLRARPRSLRPNRFEGRQEAGEGEAREDRPSRSPKQTRRSRTKAEARQIRVEGGRRRKSKSAKSGVKPAKGDATTEKDG